MNNPRNAKLTHSCARRSNYAPRLALLLLLALPAAVQAQFLYVANNGAITITGYTGPGGDVSIPDTVGGLPVTIIGTNAFFACTNLSSVTIPNSVTSVQRGAFYYCISLTSVTIGSGVTRIGDWAFSGCGSLTSVTIPNSVSSIGHQAFEHCGSLTGVTIGSGVTSIGYEPFGDCTNLTSITVDTLNSTYSSLDGVLFNKTQTTLVQYPAGIAATSYTIPNGVTGIESWAFAYCTSLTSVMIPDSVTDIGDGAFGWCTRLTNVAMGNGVTSIGDHAFQSCTRLTGVYFESNAPSLGGVYVFQDDNDATVYYLPGTTGWGSTFGGLPTALWQPPPPGAWTLAASTITPTGATLNGTVNPNGFLTAAWFQWGTTTTYGNVTPVTGMGSGTNALALAAPVAGLVLGTTYHFRAAATNIAGVDYGSDQSFIAARAGGMVTNCTEADLRAAMAGGGTVTFACDGTITLASTINIAADTTLDASGHHVIISGNGAVRVFYVNANVDFTLINLTVAYGFCSDWGAGILNDGGMVSLIGVTFTGNRVTSSYAGGTGRGGAICNLGQLAVRTSSFLTNQASGARGGDGCCVFDSPGGPGGSGLGGALDNEGTASIASSTFAGNVAYGGQGGAGVGDHGGGKGGG